MIGQTLMTKRKMILLLEAKTAMKENPDNVHASPSLMTQVRRRMMTMTRRRPQKSVVLMVANAQTGELNN